MTGRKPLVREGFHVVEEGGGGQQIHKPADEFPQTHNP
jgi:hypothetical protein